MKSIKGENMMAEISIIPLDKGPSLSEYVAKMIEIIENSGLEYKMNPMGTVIEGPRAEVFALIQNCHNKMLEYSDRVVTTIKIDDKKDKSDLMRQKLDSVESKLQFEPKK
jgi:uncharacterized protein (TIGR00106 family)